MPSLAPTVAFAALPSSMKPIPTANWSACTKAGSAACGSTSSSTWGAADFDFFHRTVDRVKALGWHLILHLDSNDIVEFEDLFRKLPVPIVIDHMGRVNAADGLDQKPFRILLEFMKHENTWVKVCGAERVSAKGPPFTDAVPFAKALIDVAPERILWGTAWPHPNVKYMPNDADLVDLIPLMAPDPAIQQKLLVDNPARLYGF
jgi:2-pyrone-4,6-dicarboxylate lactonase